MPEGTAMVTSLENRVRPHFWHRPPEPEWEREVVSAAERAGRTLEQGETEAGQVVWRWSGPDESVPRFLSRRVAVAWMADVLERDDRHAM
jgi:hypothetical protein